MALVSFPITGRLSSPHPYTFQAICASHYPSSHGKLCCKASAFCGYNNLRFSYQPATNTKFSSRHTDPLLVPFSAKKSEPGDGDSRALETVLRLYSAIKNRSVRELSDVIGDECQCVSNFFSDFQPFQGKKRVLDFFSYLIRSLGNNIEFVVTPTKHEGMNVGIKWRLECSKTHVPLGKGFSFYICHVYHGKVVIRNVEMFLEPLLQIEPFRLKIIGYLTIAMDKMSSNLQLKDNKRAILLTLLIMITLIFSVNFSS